MNLQVSCVCGQRLVIKRELANQAFQCPKCKTPLSISIPPSAAHPPASAPPAPQPVRPPQPLAQTDWSRPYAAVKPKKKRKPKKKNNPAVVWIATSISTVIGLAIVGGIIYWVSAGGLDSTKPKSQSSDALASQFKSRPSRISDQERRENKQRFDQYVSGSDNSANDAIVNPNGPAWFQVSDIKVQSNAPTDTISAKWKLVEGRFDPKSKYVWVVEKTSGRGRDRYLKVDIDNTAATNGRLSVRAEDHSTDAFRANKYICYIEKQPADEKPLIYGLSGPMKQFEKASGVGRPNGPATSRTRGR